jgi:hypothetical protein
MVFLHIDKKKYEDDGEKLVEDLYKNTANKDNKIFLLIFMEGCGPCNETRPEWSKLENVLSNDFLNRDDIYVYSIDHTLLDEKDQDKTKIIQSPSSFPTMRFITNGGKSVENYEDSSIENKDRSIDSFIEWIKSKTNEENITKSEHNGGRKMRKTRKTKTKRRKYKKSIKRRKTRRNSRK